MLSSKLSNYPECSSIPALIHDIDCRISELANVLYNNVVFILNQPIQGDVINDLLNYKRILTHKYCNPNYASCYTVDMIASRVKILKYK